jgi:subtilisin family serine protease
MIQHARVRRTAATIAASALLATTAATAVAGTATADDLPPADPTSTVEAASSWATFTLVTGDVVEARIDADGNVAEARLVSDGVDPVYSTWVRDGRTYLVPSVAQPLVDDGSLDLALFDITGLWEDGYDDASTDALPIIVEYADGAQARSQARGTVTTVEIDAIDAAAVSVDKDRAAAAWSALEPGSAARSSAGVEKIWLDAKVRATAVDDLAPTVPLTGAGAAHELGLDGEGVTVAVLDSGYDAAHVDLTGQVADSRSFVTYGGTTVQDANGHGTHVAGSVAGTGAASDGTYAGVAPGADLLVGKVLGDDGSGQSSWILAGMQWAVDAGADVVSMSLGNSAATSCSGPDVDLVQALSDEALFVVAAGNEGLHGQVSTPGCAPAALTVGAVDRDDATASFSSRGPSVGGTAAKPDIASQGVDVVSARTGGGTDMPYVAFSGTSMATPHVAGGAAIVLQAHPEYTPAQVKAALTSAVKASDAPPLDQGAGPMDVGRAVTQDVTGAPGTELASFGYPQADLAPRTRAVRLSNSSDEDVTLDLTVDGFGQDGSSVPRRMFTVGLKKNRVVVPAGGTADVPVTIDPTVPLQADDYGTVTARLVGTAGDTRVTVPFSVLMEGPTASVVVSLTDRFGQAPDSNSSFQVIDVERGRDYRYGVGSGEVALTLPHGTYEIAGTLLTRDAPGNQGQVASVSLVHETVTVDGDTTVALDARDARELSWRTDEPTEAQGYSIGYTYALGDEGSRRTGVLTTVPSYVKGLYTSGGRVDDRYTFEATARLVAPGVTFTSTGGRTLDDLPVAFAAAFDGTGSAPVVHVGPGTAENLAAADVEGRIVVVDASSSVQGGNTLAWDRALAGRGAVGLLAYSSTNVGRINLGGSGVTLPMASITAADAEALVAEVAAGGTTVSWDGTAVASSPYMYNVATVVDGKVPGGRQRVEASDLATVPTAFYTQGVDQRTWYLDLALTMPGVSSSVYAGGTMLPVTAPAERTVYYTASDDFAWTTISRMTSNIASAASFDGPRTYAPGSTEPTSWFKTPLGATSNTYDRPLATRSLNALSLALSTWGDAAGHDSTGLAYQDSTLRRVWVDDVAVNPAVGGVYALPAEDAEVHVQTAFTRRPSTVTTLGLAFTTDWTFPTGRADQGAQPLLVPSVDVDMDLTNRVLAGTDAHVTLAASSDATKERVDLDDVTLQYAVGDQTTVAAVPTWTDVAVTRGADGTWTADVPTDAPVGSFVHLRTTMTAADGSAVTQAMVRTYQVGGRLDLVVNARSQCVDDRAMVAVHARNTGEHTADVTLTSPWGTVTVEDVAPGQGAYRLFDTGAARLRTGGVADVVATGTVGTLAVTTRYEAGYEPVRCGR